MPFRRPAKGLSFSAPSERKGGGGAEGRGGEEGRDERGETAGGQRESTPSLQQLKHAQITKNLTVCLV